MSVYHSTSANSSACERCGALPPDQFRRAHRDEGGFRVALRRTNRRRIDGGFLSYYADRLARAGIDVAGLAGSLVCSTCHKTIIRAINETETNA